MRIFITGAAGFIGFHLGKELLERGDEVIGLDNINDYYDVNLKYARLNEIGIVKEEIAYNESISSKKYPNFRFVKVNIEDKESILNLFASENPDMVCHLAAQVGVRYSLINPDKYIQSNIIGFLNILEGCRFYPVSHLIYASSSSVYGLNRQQPFSTKHSTDHPISLYAVTKKSNELMAHTYSYLFDIPTTGLRFFTVYGPWGRPDMAPFLFAKAIFEGQPIHVFNNGVMFRDFTYIDDIINGIILIMSSSPLSNFSWNGYNPDSSFSTAKYRLYNLGNNRSIHLMDFIAAIENKLGVKAVKNYLPLQAGDLPSTLADITDLENEFQFKPKTLLNTGVSNFIDWFRDYYKK